MVRAGVEAAIANATMTAEGFLIPSELYTNAAKHHASTNIHRMMMLIQDIAGGSLINAPLPGDLESEEIGALVKKYMRGTDWADGEYRARLLYGARDIVADTYAGHWQVAGLHGSGGPYAQRLVAPQGLRHGHCQAAGAGCHQAASGRAGAVTADWLVLEATRTEEVAEDGLAALCVLARRGGCR